MEYYTKKVSKRKRNIILISISLLICFYTVLFLFDKKVFPYVMEIAELKAKTQTIQIINQNSMKVLNEKFKYNEITVIEKDNEGRVVLLQIDNAKLNYIASEMEDECNKALEEMSNEKVEVPLGWFTEKSIFYNYGPKISMMVQPIGNINIVYESKFESAGINQTRHKIYLKVRGKIKMKVPMKSEEINIVSEIPVSDTIIVGEIPDMSLYSNEQK